MKDTKKPLLTAFYIIIPLLLVLSPNFAYVMAFEGGNLKKALGRVLYFLLLFLAPLGLFSRRPRWYFYLLIPVLLAALLTDYLHLVANAPVSTENLLMVFETNTKEGYEFFTAAPKLCWLVALVALSLYSFCVRRLPERLSTGRTAVVSAACLALFLSFPLIRYGTAEYATNLVESTKYFFPFTYYTRGIPALAIVRDMKDFAANTRSFSFGATKTPLAGRREIDVLVIGESSRRDSWGLYGYPRDTNPLLKARELIVFKDALASGYVTNTAVPIMITRASPSNFDRHFREKSVLGAFREAGFTTYWINAQGAGQSIIIHALEAQHYLNPTIDYEERLPALLRDLVAKEKSDRILLVFHTSGSHWRYDLRYPDSFNVFRPSLKEAWAASSDRSKRDILVNSYDNSIRYTDAVLDGFIGALDSLGAVSTLVFMSDHGENLLDDDRGLSLHGQASRFTAAVPLIVWTSKAYQAAYPDKVRRLAANRTRKVSTENVFYSLVDLANIKLRDGDANKSFASSSFKETDRLMITDGGLKRSEDVK